MISFLKNFLAGDKSPVVHHASNGKHDVMMIGDDASDEVTAEEKTGCDAPAEYSGCGGCGCRR